MAKLEELLTITGCCLAVACAWHIYWPLALGVAGALCMVAAYSINRSRNRSEKR